ncbi:hypothetical protein [Blastococcus xanthinilyticus]|uniref:hypothetical protein n=1 Tax=Blastococcus xanthinilyticus TaxID=1564164 RepID=UPI0014124168|nr:hypothetical protein [Blastococcus xanthinilyticus]
MPARPRPRRLLARRAHPELSPQQAVEAAGTLVAAGRRVSLEVADPAAVAVVAAGVVDAGLADRCEVTLSSGALPGGSSGVPVARLAGLTVDLALAGPAAVVDPVARALPGARVVVAAGSPAAEDRCRALAGRRVRLVAGRGTGAELAFVRCLNVLMAGAGEPAVATVDPRLIAITGERAAWNGRTPDSWEHVMPWGEPTEDQHRVLAAGYAVRVLVPVAGDRA